MNMTQGNPDIPNALLERFPPALRAQMMARGERIVLDQHQTLCAPGQPLQGAYFPFACMISLVHRTRDGRMVEIASASSEGMLGISAVLAGTPPDFEAIVQLPGPALRVDLPWLRAAAAASPEAHDLLLRYSRFVTLQIAQLAICNALHGAEQRCCRWLLASSDRLHTDLLPLSREYLALLLGVRTAGAAAILDQLQSAGMLRQQPNRIGLTDRPALRARACECYEASRRHFDALVGPRPRTTR
jgi:CRP-like cAMP-binding protein